MRHNNNGFWAFFLMATLITDYGIYMLTTEMTISGVSGKTLQKTSYGGHLVIFIGLVFFVVAYYGLSPFSKVRRFFEGGIGKRPDRPMDRASRGPRTKKGHKLNSDQPK